MKRLSHRREEIPARWEIDPEDEMRFSELLDTEEDQSWFAPQFSRAHRADRRRHAARRRRQSSRWDLEEGNW